MAILAASICTRGGKPVLSRQFRDMPRSRVEALLASFPKLADTGTQHTTVETDTIRFVYQPLDEMYMVLITNRQSNILQDISSLHLFAQVVTSTCKSLDEREILRHVYDLLSAFDELVTLGYRENLTISQIKTFLEMDSHEERIQEIIARNKELEATEERKRKAKQLEIQRKEAARLGRAAGPRTPVYPTYTPPAQSAAGTYDSYEAEKNKTYNNRTSAPKVKGMQLGKKSKTTDMFEKVRGDLAAGDDSAPLVGAAPGSGSGSGRTVAPAAAADLTSSEPRPSSATDRDPIHLIIRETIGVTLSRDGAPAALTINGDLTLRIADPSLTRLRLALTASPTHGAQFKTHPQVDRAAFGASKAIQLKPEAAAKGFPVNNSVTVLRWRAAPKQDDQAAALPLGFTVWINKDSDRCSVTVEYELAAAAAAELRDVSLAIPFRVEPSVSSFGSDYEITADVLRWNIGSVDEASGTGSLEFEADTADEDAFFPMVVSFSSTKPLVDVDVLSVSLTEMDQDMTFSKELKSGAENYKIE